MAVAPCGGSGVPAAMWMSPASATRRGRRLMMIRPVSALRSGWRMNHTAGAISSSEAVRPRTPSAPRTMATTPAPTSPGRPARPTRRRRSPGRDSQAEAVSTMYRVQSASAGADASSAAPDHTGPCPARAGPVRYRSRIGKRRWARAAEPYVGGRWRGHGGSGRTRSRRAWSSSTARRVELPVRAYRRP